MTRGKLNKIKLNCLPADEDKWGKRFPSCEGMAQSPINIETNSITDDSNLSVELMPSYNSKISVASLVNTGLTCELF